MMRESISNINLQRHCLASGTIMREIAAARGADQDLWEIAGLLHDLDYEHTEHDPARHGLETASRLRGVIPDEYVHAIESHNSENNGVARTNDLDRLLTASECVTGLITATALVYPDRRLAGVEPQAVIKRMTKSGFARSVSREGIRECEAAGWDLDSFVATALRAMKSISDDLGL
jgi:uncharacterized protein